MANVKLSQIASGGALNIATDTLVSVRSGTTDVLVIPGTLATLNTVALASNVSGTLPFGNGGTGQTAYTDGQLLIGNTATGGLSKATITAGSNITVTNGNGTITIASSGGGSSAFNSLTSGTNTTAAMVVGSGATLAPSGTGTIEATSLASATTIVSVASATAPTSGQVLTATSGTAAIWQTPSGGGGGLTFNNVTGTTQSMAVNNGYIANNAALVTATLPVAATIGQVVAIVGNGAGGWKIGQNSGQTIHQSFSKSSTTGTGGSFASTNLYDSAELICVATNTDWVVRSSSGNLTIV